MSRKKTERRFAAAFAALDRLYADLPTVACTGGCAIACGAIPLTEIEARRLQLATRVKPRTVIKLLANGGPTTLRERERCIYLDARDRCSAYAVRPLICRAWGVLKALSCMRGCVPTEWLTPTRYALIAQPVERIGGGRIIRTAPEGLIVIPGETYSVLVPQRAEAAIAADAERTRSLRALHGGRIIAAVMSEEER